MVDTLTVFWDVASFVNLYYIIRLNLDHYFNDTVRLFLTKNQAQIITAFSNSNWCLQWHRRGPPQTPRWGDMCRGGVPNIRILKFVEGYFGPDSVVLTEGSILRSWYEIWEYLRQQVQVDPGWLFFTQLKYGFVLSKFLHQLMYKFFKRLVPNSAAEIH